MKQLQTWLPMLYVALLGIAVWSAINSARDMTAIDQDRGADLQYLETVIPPCTEIAGSSRDPCKGGRLPDFGSSATTGYFAEVPNYWDLYHEGPWGDVFIPHLVIRSSYLPNTTRCGMYEREFPAFTDFRLPSDHYAALCFTEARVNEYLIGAGPPQLTVQSHGRPVLYTQGDSLDWVAGLSDNVGPALEGRELILFLAPSMTTVIEAWWAIESWEIRRINGAVTVVAPFKEALELNGIYDPEPSEDRYYRDLTQEESALLEVPLDEFQRTIAAAAVRRATATEGRIAKGDDYPMLVTDANLLRPYYEGPGVGIVYETDAPAKPPPVPGEEDPVYPPGQVDDDDDGLPTVTFPDEEPTPPQDTDTTTTTTILPVSTTTTTVGS